jgi:hypothetical protein
MEVIRRRPGVVARRPTPKTTVPAASERLLPPKVPDTLPEVDEAMMLLGNYVQSVQAGGKFRESLRARLQALIGAVPSLPDAKAWKSGLKELRGELAALERRGSG